MKLTIIFFIAIMSAYLVSANDILTVEANIFEEDSPDDEISIEVPNYLFLGNISEGDSSEKVQVFVNNTGKTDIKITPRLIDQNDEIFSNLYFQNRKTGSNTQIYKIGEYNFEISKPSSSQSRSEYFWMWLDLSDIDPNTINKDLVGKKAEVRFVATAIN